MKPRTQFFMALGFLLLILGIAWVTFPERNQELAQVFPATINRDCAPWDGAAFTVSIPMSEGASIAISIYQSPDIKLPVTFSFPDETMSVGNVIYLPKVGSSEQLTGKVSFQRVIENSLVEGKFKFVTERGEQFIGRFQAEWKNQPMYCG
ncbi:MAG TPA: hypothetical protein VF896_10760 [Anaerolineales bacterium]